MNQDLIEQELSTQDVYSQYKSTQDLIEQELSTQDVCSQDKSTPDLSSQDLIYKIENLEYTINQLYNKNYYLMEIISDKEIQFHEKQCELHNNINSLSQELQSYKKPLISPILTKATSTDRVIETAIDTAIDTAIAREIEAIEEKYQLLEEQLREKDRELNEKNMQLIEKDRELKEKDNEFEKKYNILDDKNMELRVKNMKLREKKEQQQKAEAEAEAEAETNIESRVTNIVEEKHNASWSGIVSGKEQQIREIVKEIPDLSNSTIIKAKVGDYTLYPNALKWKSLHIYICKNVINRNSIDYLIQHSSMKIIKNDRNVRGYIRRLGISIQYLDTQSIFKDINYLLTLINEQLELTVKLSNDNLYTF